MNLVETRRPLLDALARWRGRGATQSAFEERGFLLHRQWQERVLEFCGIEQTPDVNRYWDDYAMEYVCCAGRGNPDSHRFTIEPTFRSAYLDELRSQQDYLAPPYHGAPLVRCLYEYRLKWNRDRPFALDEKAFFEQLKLRETQRLAISADGPISYKRDILPYLKQFSQARGFGAKPFRKGGFDKSFTKASSNGLVFDIDLDFGGIPQLAGQLPLVFSAFHITSPGVVFVIHLDSIVPGFAQYRFGVSRESWVLCVLAHVELFDTFFHALPDR